MSWTPAGPPPVGGVTRTIPAVPGRGSEPYTHRMRREGHDAVLRYRACVPRVSRIAAAAVLQERHRAAAAGGSWRQRQPMVAAPTVGPGRGPRAGGPPVVGEDPGRSVSPGRARPRRRRERVKMRLPGGLRAAAIHGAKRSRAAAVCRRLLGRGTAPPDYEQLPVGAGTERNLVRAGRGSRSWDGGAKRLDSPAADYLSA